MQNAVNDRPCILIEGPGWGDADFYSRWSLAAAEAQRLFAEATKDEVFKDEIFVLQFVYRIDLGIMASDMLQKLFEDELAAIIRLDGKTDENEDAFLVLEAFTTLAALGFFTVTGERYQMAIPPKLDLKTVKRTFIKLAADAEALIPIEKVVTTMPRAGAKRWQKLLTTMDERQRVADRNALLE
jgi:hypothetical protein